MLRKSTPTARVGIVMPLYNVESLIARTIGFLQAQTFADFEAILVDDGSSDQTVEVARHAIGEDPRFRILEQKNAGAGAARNFGLAHTSAETVIFLDSDDIFLPRLLERAYRRLKQTDAEMVIFGYDEVDRGRVSVFPEFLRARETFSSADVSEQIFQLFNPAPWMKLYRRDFLERHHLQFQDVATGNDIAFHYLSLAQAKKVALWDETLVRYNNCRTGQLTKMIGPENALNIVTTMNYVKSELTRLKLDKRFESSLELAFLAGCNHALLYRANLEAQQVLARHLHEIFGREIFLAKMNPRELHVEQLVTYLACAYFAAPLDMIHEYNRVRETTCGRGVPGFLRQMWQMAGKSENPAAVRADILFFVRGKIRSWWPQYRPDKLLKSGFKAIALKLPGVGDYIRSHQLHFEQAEFYRQENERLALLAASGKPILSSDLVSEYKTLRFVRRELVAAAEMGAPTPLPKVQAGERELIVTLTSYPERIEQLEWTLRSLWAQTLQPNRVILNLATTQFPGGKDDLPAGVRRFLPCGLEVYFDEDWRSFKKLVPTWQRFPDALLVTADDDIYYPPRWLQFLRKSLEKHPEAIQINRAHLITFDGDQLMPCLSWRQCLAGEWPDSVRNFPTTGGGVLFPPGTLHSDFTQDELFTALCPEADDIWVWAMAVLAGTPLHVVNNDGLMSRLICLDPVREHLHLGSALWYRNRRGGNDEQLAAVLAHYPQLGKILRAANRKQ